MNEKMRMLLSAYLDGQVTPEERLTVETLLQKDAAAREELEALRQWSQDISASAPPPVQAPSGFRQKIMQQLDASGDLPPGTTGSGGLLPWLITGTVLVGLVGGLMYLDHTRNRVQVSSPVGVTTDESLAIVHGQGRPENQPAYRGQAGNLEIETQARRSEIQGRSAMPNRFDDLTASSLPLEGGVFVSGQGQFKRKKGSGSMPGIPVIDYPDQSGRGAAPVNRLEVFQNWTRTDVQDLYRRSGRQPVSPAEDILRWAKQYRLNPGLIVAGTLIQEPFVPESTLPEIRRVLDASAGQPEAERLRQVIELLAGPGTSAEAWESFLNKPE